MIGRQSAFSGQRLRVARHFNGLTLSELADRSGMSAPFLSCCEGEQKAPGVSALDSLAECLGFAPEFFLSPGIDEYREDQCFFRRRKTTLVSHKQRVLAHGTLFGSVLGLLDKHVEFMPDTLAPAPATVRQDVERVAERTRLKLDLTIDAPIDSMMRVLENAGVIVHRFQANAPKVDAFSRAIGHKVVVLNSDKTSCAQIRWDMAHELGHLILHAGLDAGAPAQEQEAEWFAAAFLLPRAGFIRSFASNRVSDLDVDALLELKLTWKATLPAMVRRAFDLERVSAAAYHRAFKRLAWHRYTAVGAQEPNDSADEVPEMFDAGLQTVLSEGGSEQSISRELGWDVATLRKVIDLPAPPALAPPKPIERPESNDQSKPWSRYLRAVPRND